MVETCDKIKFFVNLGYEPNEMFSLLKSGGDALEMKKNQFSSGTRGLSKDKRAFKMVLGADAGRKLVVIWRRTAKDDVYGLLNYDKTWYQAILQRWVEHHQKCVRENGQYFEKL